MLRPLGQPTGASADVLTQVCTCACTGEMRRLEKMVELLETQMASQQKQGEQQLESKDKQIGELHVLLQQTQAALPAPKENRPWWRLW